MKTITIELTQKEALALKHIIRMSKVDLDDIEYFTAKIDEQE